MSLVNHRFTLAKRPVGLPKATDFTFEQTEAPAPADGEELLPVAARDAIERVPVSRSHEGEDDVRAAGALGPHTIEMRHERRT